MTTNAPPRLLNLLPGRARFHLPAWSGNDPEAVESYLQSMDGLSQAQANPLSGNVLVRFDPRDLSAERVLSELSTLQAAWCSSKDPKLTSRRSPSESGSVTGKSVVARAVLGGTLGHVAVDALFYSAAAAATAMGATWVGALVGAHLVLDVFVWGVALRPVAQHFRRLPGPAP